MKRFSLFFALTATLALLSGCCFSEVYLDDAPEGCIAPDGYRAVAVGTASNDGFYLFNKWPLRSGNINRPNTHDYCSFDDYAKPECTSTMLLAAMRKVYKADDLCDIQHTETSTGWFSLWIVWRRYVRTEAIGVVKVDEKE